MSMLCTSHAVNLAAGRRVVARDGGPDAYIVPPGGLRFIGQMTDLCLPLRLPGRQPGLSA
jgi:hypothetical protein